MEHHWLQDPEVRIYPKGYLISIFSGIISIPYGYYVDEKAMKHETKHLTSPEAIRVAMIKMLAAGGPRIRLERPAPTPARLPMLVL